LTASELFVAEVASQLSISSIEDLFEAVFDTIDRATMLRVQDSFGVPEVPTIPSESFGEFCVPLENLGKHVMRILRKVRTKVKFKQSVIRSLKAHEAAGTFPPTLIVRVPASMDSDKYPRLGGAAHASFLELLNSDPKAGFGVHQRAPGG
jgi:hypothetical protein